MEVPFTRWELEEVWDPNPDAQGKMHLNCRKGTSRPFCLEVLFLKPGLILNPRYPRHGNFVEGAEFFDAKYFGISPPEAASLELVGPAQPCGPDLGSTCGA